MTYTKPKLTILGDAVKRIQQQANKLSTTTDAGVMFKSPNSAYELDE